jgi:hypothetical protein
MDVDEREPVYVEWKMLPRGDVAPHWSGLYVTLNRQGWLVVSGRTHKRLGAPQAYQIMYDEFNRRLALKPAKRDAPHAYPAGINGRYGGKIIRAYRLLTEFGIRPTDTIEFLQPKIGEDGELILSLKRIRISPKAHSQCRGIER